MKLSSPSSILKVLLISLLVVSLLVSGLIGGLLWYGTWTPIRGGAFTLNFRGQEWNFKTHAKKLNLLYFGYTKCPDVCPMTLSFSADAFRKLSQAELEQVQLIFISVDQEHDTASAVADYAAQFYSSFLGLTGSKIQLDQAVNLFGASYMVEANLKSYLGYSIIHTDRLFFLNQKGQIVDNIPNPRSDDLILEKIKEHL